MNLSNFDDRKHRILIRLYQREQNLLLGLMKPYNNQFFLENDSIGEYILYINGAYRGDTPVGRLMHDFSCTDARDMYYGILADRVRFFKESKEGIEIMCRAMEDIRNQTLKEGMKEVVLRMLAAGKYELEEIADISGLSVEEVKQLKADRSA